MKIINLKDTIFREGEYIVGAEQTHSHACYMLYGILKPAESRNISPGLGHEEIFCCLEGEVLATANGEEHEVQKGQCFHLKGDESVEISNERPNSVVYVLAGGHSDASHHQQQGGHGEHDHSH